VQWTYQDFTPIHTNDRKEVIIMENTIQRIRNVFTRDFLPFVGLALLAFFIVISFNSPAWAKHTVLGKITYSDGKPAAGILVVAMDSDAGGNINKDDKLGQANTNAQGNYNINYAGKSWDPKVPGSTAWRPDIYINVFRNVGGMWAHVAKSSVHKDWKLAQDLTINMTIPADQWQERLTRFNPANHGWPFPNTKFKNTCVHLLHTAAQVCGPYSLCGGMSLSALRRFKRNAPVENVLTEKVHSELEKAQEDTLGAGVMTKFAEWSVYPSQPGTLKPHTIGHRTMEEWPHIRGAVDSGNPIVMGIVRVDDDDIKRSGRNVFNNHQVLAIGYRVNNATGETFIYLYDPNHPQQRSAITFYTKFPNSQIHAKQDTGERVRGFFDIKVN
jgi:hypothetical protein